MKFSNVLTIGGIAVAMAIPRAAHAVVWITPGQESESDCNVVLQFEWDGEEVVYQGQTAEFEGNKWYVAVTIAKESQDAKEKIRYIARHKTDNCHNDVDKPTGEQLNTAREIPAPDEIDPPSHKPPAKKHAKHKTAAGNPDHYDYYTMRFTRNLDGSAVIAFIGTHSVDAPPGLRSSPALSGGALLALCGLLLGGLVLIARRQNEQSAIQGKDQIHSHRNRSPEAQEHRRWWN